MDFKCELDVKAKNSSLFKNPERANVSRVESGTGATSTGAKLKYGYHDLSPAQKEVASMFKNRGIMTVEAYIKSLTEMGELK